MSYLKKRNRQSKGNPASPARNLAEQNGIVLVDASYNAYHVAVIDENLANSLSPDGLLSGLPTESGSFALIIQVSDGAGSPVRKSLHLDVQPLSSGEGLFKFNGRIQTIPVLMDHGIPYLPTWYLMQELNTVGTQSRWLGQDWYLSTMTQPYLYFLQPGSGTTSIYLNGVLVQNVTTESATDPSTHGLTTFMPLWSLTGLLHRGYQTSWDGTTWTVTN